MKRTTVVLFAMVLPAASTAAAQPPPEGDATPARGEQVVASDDPAVERPSKAEPLAIATGESRPPPPLLTEPYHGGVPFEEDSRFLGPRRWHTGVAGGVAFGAMFIKGIDRGYYGRVEVGGYDVQHRRRGFIVGMLTGIEGWGAPAAGDQTNWGGSLPVLFYGGIQSDAAFIVLGGGFDVFVLDRIEGDTGYGLFGPQAMANVGFDLEGVRFLVDGRASYRWHFGVEDRTAFRLGGAIHLTTD